MHIANYLTHRLKANKDMIWFFLLFYFLSEMQDRLTEFFLYYNMLQKLNMLALLILQTTLH